MDPTAEEDLLASNARRLAATLEKLSTIQEPSELVYGQPPLPTTEPPDGVVEDYSVTIARRVSTVLSRLAELSQSSRQRVLTPRAVLLELMDIVQHGLFLALPPAMRHVGREHASLASSYHTYVSSRRVPIESMMEGLYGLTYVSVKLRLELVMLQLRQRVALEMATLEKDIASGRGGANADRPAEEQLAALLVTQTLLDDFAEVFNNSLLLTPVLATAAAAALNGGLSNNEHHRRSPLAPGTSQLDLRDASALVALVPTLERYYYQLGDWTMRTAGEAAATPISYTRVTRAALDAEQGLVTCELHRTDVASPWGLLFNECGRLIGTDTSMRVTDRARQLNVFLRCSQEGAAVVAVNDVPVDASSSAADDSGRAVLQAVQNASLNRKRLKLTLASPNFKDTVVHAPAELVFSCPPQGGEGASGQRASLLLHRLHTGTPWQFAIDADLMWFPPPPTLLSPAVQQFVQRFPYRLRVFAVNGVEVQSPEQLRDLVGRAEVLLLELVVVPSGDVAPKGNPGTRAPQSQPKAPTPTIADVTAIERQVREATQRLMLSHAQQEELREAPLVEWATPPDVDDAVEDGSVPANVTAGDGVYEDPMATTSDPPLASHTLTAAAESIDAVADRILREMLLEAGVDTGDAPAEALPSAADGSEGPPALPLSEPLPDPNTMDSGVAAAGPCQFAHGVQLMSFAGDEMVFSRSSLEHPWGIKITQNTSLDVRDAAGQILPLRVLALPEPLPTSSSHPFLARFNEGDAAWLIARINGKSAAADPKKTLALMRKATRMTLRLLRA